MPAPTALLMRKNKLHLAVREEPALCVNEKTCLCIRVCVSVVHVCVCVYGACVCACECVCLWCMYVCVCVYSGNSKLNGVVIN
jgi:hypothetical protein